jgi:hypothetical protein
MQAPSTSRFVVATRRAVVAASLVVLMALALALPALAVDNTASYVRTSAAQVIDDFDAYLNGNLITLNGTWTSVGFRWGTNATLATSTNVTVQNMTVAGTFSYLLGSLKAQTTYYFRAWAVNLNRTASPHHELFKLAQILSFTTTGVTVAIGNVVNIIPTILEVVIIIGVFMGVIALITTTLRKAGSQSGALTRRGDGKR